MSGAGALVWLREGVERAGDVDPHAVLASAGLLAGQMKGRGEAGCGAGKGPLWGT